MCVLDVGGSYRHMCELVGGTFTRVMPDGSLCEERYGAVALVVFELGALVGLPDARVRASTFRASTHKGY